MRNLINTFSQEQNRFGAISFLLIFTSILGGIATGLFLSNLFVLSLVVGVTMATEVAILAVLPMKTIFRISLVASVINLVCIITGLI